MRYAVLIGGPLCGALLPQRAGRGAWIWARPGVLNSTEYVAAFSTPGPGRELYRHTGSTAGHDTFLYSGHTHALCTCCRALNARNDADRCVMCGGELLAPPV